MEVPFSCTLDDGEVKKATRKLIMEQLGAQYYAVIVVDRDNFVHASNLS